MQVLNFPVGYFVIKADRSLLEVGQIFIPISLITWVLALLGQADGVIERLRMLDGGLEVHSRASVRDVLL